MENLKWEADQKEREIQFLKQQLDLTEQQSRRELDGAEQSLQVPGAQPEVMGQISPQTAVTRAGTAPAASAMTVGPRYPTSQRCPGHAAGGGRGHQSLVVPGAVLTAGGLGACLVGSGSTGHQDRLSLFHSS